MIQHTGKANTMLNEIIVGVCLLDNGWAFPEWSNSGNPANTTSSIFTSNRLPYKSPFTASKFPRTLSSHLKWLNGNVVFMWISSHLKQSQHFSTLSDWTVLNKWLQWIYWLNQSGIDTYPSKVSPDIFDLDASLKL